MLELLLLALAVLLIVANGIFVAAEFSFVSVNRSTVEQAAESGDARAASLQKALKSMSTQLSGSQLGITVTSLVVGYLAEPSIAELLRGPIGAADLSEGTTTALAVGLGLVLATVFQMIFGELVPKNWAIAEPLRVGRAVAGFQRGFTRAGKPLIVMLNGAANALIRLLGIEPQEELASARSPQELASAAARSAREGTLDTTTASLVERSIEFGNRTAADVMTPRPRVRFLAAEDPIRCVLEVAGQTGHARFPVIGANVDEVLGAVHFKHALAVPADEREKRTVREVLHELTAVPASMELDPLLSTLREPGLQMAVVIDEYGGTAGVVTLEDLVEEIVGEIADEQDLPVRRSRQVSQDCWSLSGMLRPDEVGDVTGLDLPEGQETDTLGGLIVEQLGRLPQVGDVVTLLAKDTMDLDEDEIPKTATVSVEVARLDGWRIDRAVVRRGSAEDVPAQAETSR